MVQRLRLCASRQGLEDLSLVGEIRSPMLGDVAKTRQNYCQNITIKYDLHFAKRQGMINL